MNTPLRNPNSTVEFLTATQVSKAFTEFNFAKAHGSFSSTETQNIPLLPSSMSLTYDTTDLVGGGMILSGSLPSGSIRIPHSGTYRVITSVQLDKTSGGGGGEVDIWFAVDGVPVPNSATKTELTNQIEVVMTVEVLLGLTSGQEVSVEIASNSADCRALSVVASPPVPVIPSVITIVQRIA
jgi:hypothetical protein